MTDVNNVTIIGRLTRDCEISYISNGTAKGLISLAVGRSRKQGDNWVDDTSYFDVILWGKMAESLKEKLKKGCPVAVDGYLKQDRWEKDGQRCSKVYIVAEMVQVFGTGKKEETKTEEFKEDCPW